MSQTGPLTGDGNTPCTAFRWDDQSDAQEPCRGVVPCASAANTDNEYLSSKANGNTFKLYPCNGFPAPDGDVIWLQFDVPPGVLDWELQVVNNTDGGSPPMYWQLFTAGSPTDPYANGGCNLGYPTTLQGDCKILSGPVACGDANQWNDISVTVSGKYTNYYLAVYANKWHKQFSFIFKGRKACPKCFLKVSVNDAEVCEGYSATLTATASNGTEPYTYKWSTSATTQSITVSTAGTYSVTVTDKKGCAATGSGTLKVNPNPTCKITGPAGVCAGYKADLTVAGSGGTSPYTYAWELDNDGLFDDATGATVNVAPGTYSAKVTDSKACTSTCSYTLLKYENPTCKITGPAGVCDGYKADLTVAGSGGTSPYAYAWDLDNDGLFDDATGATVNVAPGTYSAKVTDSKGCTSTCSYTLLKYENPTCKITGPAGVCDGSKTDLTVAGSGGTSPYTYAWDLDNDGLFDDATGATVNVAPGTYFAKVTDSKGCTSTCSYTLLKYENPTCKITGPAGVCAGSKTDLTVAGSGGTSPYTYAWDLDNDGLFDDATTATVNVGPGKYFVKVTDAKGCTGVCDKTVLEYPLPKCHITQSLVSGGVKLTEDGGDAVSWKWSTGATAKYITVSSPGDYYVTITDGNGCTSSCYTKVVVKCETAWAKNSNSKCFDDLTQCSNAAQLQWGFTTKITDPGTYYFNLMEGAGQCTNGTDVGDVKVVYSGGKVTIEITTISGYYLSETHVWVGSTPLPLVDGKCKAAPGQFPYKAGDVISVSAPFWIAIHTVTCHFVLPTSPLMVEPEGTTFNTLPADKETALRLMPNPAGSEVFVDLSTMVGEHNATLVMYNNLGQVVYRKNIDEILDAQERIDLSAMKAGLYIVNVKVGQHYHAATLVVQNR
jgi:hypothetical protein